MRATAASGGPWTSSPIEAPGQAIWSVGHKGAPRGGSSPLLPLDRTGSSLSLGLWHWLSAEMSQSGLKWQWRTWQATFRNSEGKLRNNQEEEAQSVRSLRSRPPGYCFISTYISRGLMKLWKCRIVLCISSACNCKFKVLYQLCMSLLFYYKWCTLNIVTNILDVFFHFFHHHCHFHFNAAWK